MAEASSRRKRRSSSVDPNVLPGYRLGATVGTGTYGRVKVALHEASNKTVAIKEIKKVRLNSGGDRATVRERRFLSLLRHPNIAQLWEVHETEEKIFLVMEYCEGGELFDYIVAHKRLSEARARKFFRQIISAVGYCHSNYIVHRDLKPENLLLDSDQNVKLVDFGFTNTFERGQTMQTFCGSVQYASPEMVDGMSYEGPEVDMWSLGVILYAMVTGSLPFDHPNQTVMFDNIVSSTYNTPDYVSGACANLIKWMLTVKRDKRATVFDVLAHPWVTENGKQEAIQLYLEPRGAVATPHKHLLVKVVELGFAVDAMVTQQLKDGELTRVTCTYHLLAAQDTNPLDMSTSLDSTDGGAQVSVSKIADKAKTVRKKHTRQVSLPSIDLDNPGGASVRNISGQSKNLPSSPANADEPVFLSFQGNKSSNRKRGSNDLSMFASVEGFGNFASMTASLTKDSTVLGSPSGTGFLSGTGSGTSPAATGSAKKPPPTPKKTNASTPPSAGASVERPSTFPEMSPATPTQGFPHSLSGVPADGPVHESVSVPTATDSPQSDGHATRTITERSPMLPTILPPVGGAAVVGRRRGIDGGLTGVGSGAADTAHLPVAAPTHSGGSSPGNATVFPPPHNAVPPMIRGPVSSATTSQKDAATLLAELRRAANALGWAIDDAHGFVIDCTALQQDHWVGVSLQVCRISNLADTHTIRFRRIEGDSWAYTILCNEILNELRL